MKQKILLATIIICCTATMQAQIPKETLWLGGFINFSGNSTDGNSSEQSNSSVAFVPAIGTAIMENLVVGGEFHYYHTKYESTPPTNNQITEEVGVGVFARKYIPIVNRFYIYGHGDLGFSSIINKRFGEKGRGWATTLGLHPGASFAINKILQIESGFNNLFYIRYVKANVPELNRTETKQESYNVGVSLENGGQFYVGFRLLLPGKKSS